MGRKERVNAILDDLAAKGKKDPYALVVGKDGIARGRTEEGKMVAAYIDAHPELEKMPLREAWEQIYRAVKAQQAETNRARSCV